MWIEPKLEWTAIDYYNFEDLNRVENNMAVVADLVRFYEDLPAFVFVKNRNMEHIEFADSLNRIESIQDVLQRRARPTGWATNKTDWKAEDGFSFVDAKRLENNLYLLYRRYTGNLDLTAYCGAFTCGEVLI